MAASAVCVIRGFMSYVGVRVYPKNGENQTQVEKVVSVGQAGGLVGWWVGLG